MQNPVPAATLTRLFDAFTNQDVLTHGRLLARALRAGKTGVAQAIQAHVLGDDWMDFAHASLTALWEKNRGHLYVVANPVTPDFLKVGMTRLAPDKRVKRLNNEAVVGAYICVEHWAVHDRHFLEAEVHRSLADLPRHKEHFACHWRALCPRVAAVLAADRERFAAQGFTVPTY
jgi:hypothetical protein